MTTKSAVTGLLADWRAGDERALNRLAPLLYDELRRIASRYMAGERSDHTLQATALVNEAFVQLAESDVSAKDRSHFLALAARQMRRILVDHARARRAAKRGGGAARMPFDEAVVPGDSGADILVLDYALERLGQLDSRRSDILILHYYGGMTYDEIAEALGISPATVDRQLRLGKAYIQHELRDD